MIIEFIITSALIILIHVVNTNNLRVIIENQKIILREINALQGNNVSQNPSPIVLTYNVDQDKPNAQ